MISSRKLLSATAVAMVLSGCAGQGEIVVDQGVGITAIRPACPAVGVPDYTGDVALFASPAAGATANNIDVTAAITNLRSTCNDSSDRVYSEATFDVLASRSDTRGARRVELPFFSTVLRGGSAVQTKRVGTVVIDFADGQARAQGSGRAGAFVDKTEATLPSEIREQITRRRRAGDADAALDPLADPTVRAALTRATFELLVGFQLTEAQLTYNVTR